MQLKHRGRCHYCRAPLDPHVVVSSTYEYIQVLAWLALTHVDVTANDTWFKILSVNKTVRLCRDCFKKPTISLKDILKRETSGLKIKGPARKTWNGCEIWEWYNGIRTCPQSFFDIENPIISSNGFVIKYLDPSGAETS